MSSNKTKGQFKVAGQDHNGRWLVESPHGHECAGTWASQEDAQTDCDKWNRRTSSWQRFN